MSKEYRAETTQKYEELIDNILTSAPPYVKDFYNHMRNGRREITTQSAYIRDILGYIKYLIQTLPQFTYQNEEDADADVALVQMMRSFPIDIFDQITVKDLNEYRSYLHDEAKISNASSKKKFAALSAFYKFANAEGYVSSNPMTNFELPATNKHRIIKLDAELSNRLLDGIMRNDMYLAQTPLGEKPMPIPEQVFVKREPLVLRNYAICCLFLGAGLRVSELVGLDLDDINFRLGTVNIIAKGGDEIQVFFGDEVAKALKAYIDGVPLPSSLVDKYIHSEKEALVWCQKHTSDPDFREKFEKEFPNRGKDFYSDMSILIGAMRRQGRDGLKPMSNCNAVFISSRGKRMTVRMVQIMIKEMVKTYLPDYDDKDIFSPHKLRATCATRILTQTGDIQLASTQLNHKGIGVTAAFYAELQKEKQRDMIRELDMNKW